LAMRAGIATLKELRRPGLYEGIKALNQKFGAGLHAALSQSGIKAQINSIGSLSTIFFTAGPVTNYAQAKSSDTRMYARFFREMLNRGIFLAPSQFEAAFLSTCHTEADIERTILAAKDALKLISTTSAD
jgi:glutamate-1-semialdehyde 2,1-aminomutase